MTTIDMAKMRAVRVARRREQTGDIISLELRDVDGAELPTFAAGAHIDLHTGPGLIRQYSLCNSPMERDRYLIGVLRDPASRGGSVAIFNDCIEGAVVNISEPRNHFPLRPATRTILLAGGIGVTPLLSMAHELSARNAEFELHYCTRSASQVAFRAEIADAVFANRVQYHHSDSDENQKINLGKVLARPDADTHVYVCGSTRFIDWVHRTAADLGWQSEQVHCEYFAGKSVDASADPPFDVKIASTGQLLRIPGDRSISSVLQENGIEIYVSCEQGTCGTCVTRVLSGVPDHRDVFLTDAQHAAGNEITPCCSRARGPLLILDL